MKKYKVFISHIWEYSEYYNTVEEWLDDAQSENHLIWESTSIPFLNNDINPNSSLFENKLKRKLNIQISRSSVVLMLLSDMYFVHHDWIKYEILTAVKYNKYIIGVNAFSQEFIPQVVFKNANVVVEWDKISVINALLKC